jgi:hypothetical protein
MIKKKLLRAVGLTTAAMAATLSTAVLTSVDAQAAGDGRVTARSGLTVRYAPTKHSKAVGSIAYRSVVPLSCKVTGSNVDGNRRWYRLPGDGGPQWIAARYVKNLNRVPAWCGNDERFVGRNTNWLSVRRGPNTADARVRTVAPGTGLDLVCKVHAQRIDGNRLWYWTKGDNWVSARYVDNVGRSPNWCVEM